MYVILDLFGTLPQIKKTLTSLENQDFQDMIVLCIIKKNLVSYRTLNQIKRLYKNSSLTLHFIPEGATFPSGVISDEYNYLLLKTGDYFIENNNIVKLKEKIQNRNAIFLLKNDKQINNHYIFSYPEKFNHTVHSIVDKQNFILDYDYNRLILKGDFLNESIIFANWDDIQKCLRQKIILDDNNIYHLKNDSMVSNFLWIRKYYLSQTVIQTRLIDIYHTISSYNEIADKDLIVQFFNKDLILILERILSYPNNEEIIIFIKKIIESVPEDLSQLFDLKNRLLLAFISSHSFSTSNDVEIALQHYFTPLKIANFDNNSEHVSTESLKLILHETVHSNNTALTIDNIIYKEKSIHIKGNLYLENAFLIDLSMLNFYFSHITNKQSARIYPQKINWFSNPKYLSKRGGKLHRRGFKLSYDNDILPSSFEMIFELNDTGFDPGCYHLFLSNRINNEINDFHLQLNPVTRRSYSNSFISTNNQQIFIDVDKNNFPYLFVNDTTELESLYFENNQLYLTAQPEITPILYHRKETLSAVKKIIKSHFFL